MFRTSNGPAALGVMLVLCALISSPQARAEDDYVATLLGAVAGGSSPSLSLPFASEGGIYGPRRHMARAPHLTTSYDGSQAFCVRSCDGRYFPATGSDHQSRAASCNNFCPASKTAIVYGSNIDNAATQDGKAYSEMPNAFRYRNEIVAGCTCNGKDQIGLAPVKIEDDPTLRKGDIVAGASGLMVAGRSADRRGASLQFSPASKSLVSRYQQLPVVAAQ